ncbi:hypothetical protein [Aliiroseovarius crassostreae]|uniref:hypothetical protein n=1 Tax=Aliiroseovarius crassostreae TaxID=154981 RepID=UPI003C7B57E2
MRRVLQWIASLLFVLVISPIVGTFFIEYAKTLGFYDDPAAVVDALLMFASQIINSAAYPYVLGASGGAFAAVWLYWFAGKIERRQAKPVLLYDSELSLQFRKDPQPFEAKNLNIFRWYTFPVIMQVFDQSGQRKDENVVTTIFLTFQDLSQTAYPVLKCSDPNLRLEVKDLSSRSAIVLLHGKAEDVTIDMSFRSQPDHYLSS